MQYLDEEGLKKFWAKIKTTFQAQNDNLTNILGATGTGFLKKGANDTWSIDTSTYITGITGDMVTTALGYTPIDVLTKGAASGVATLDASAKIPLAQLPDAILGQLIYGGTVDVSGVATLSTNAKTKLGTTSNTVQLTNNTGTYGYGKCEGMFFIASADSTFASLGLKTGDWLISTGSAWKKVDNTDAVTGIKGSEEETYRIGNVNITKANIGLGNVENTKLSDWTGSTKITTLGTIATGTWHGTAIADSYIASASTWNGKYAKPSTGIPKTDLASAVQTSLGKADSAVQDANYAHITVTSTSVSDGTNTFSKYTLPQASSTALGGIKIGFTDSQKQIGVKTGNDGTAYVELTSTAIASVGALTNSTSGNAGSATKLANSRTLWGVSFDGSANLTTAPNLYIGTTKVQTSSAQQNLSGIGTLSVAGVATFSDATEATAYNAASVKLTGGLGVAKSIVAKGNISATGGVAAFGIADLNVSGSGGGGSYYPIREWTSYVASDVDQVLGANLGYALYTGKADKATSLAGYGITDAILAITKDAQDVITDFELTLGRDSSGSLNVVTVGSIDESVIEALTL